MKKLLLIPIIFLIIIGCTNDKDPKRNNIPREIVGKWKFAQYYDDMVYDITPDPHIVVDGYNLILNSDGTFTSNESIEHSGGTFSVSESFLILNYSNVYNETKMREIIYLNDSEMFLSSIDYGDFRMGERFEKISQ